MSPKKIEAKKLIIRLPDNATWDDKVTLLDYENIYHWYFNLYEKTY